MTAEEIVKKIHGIMDGEEWSPDTLDAIADVLNENGYVIRDQNEVPSDDADGADAPSA